MRVRFEAFTLDTHARQLIRAGAELHLSPKAFDLLSVLVERRPAVLDKAALRQRLWPGVHVVDASLSNLVAEIRSVLTDRKSAPALVRTVHGVGYAFSGEAVDEEAERTVKSGRAAPFWVVWKHRAIVLSRGENVIGRDAACAVWVDAGGVSRRHACIRVPADGVVERGVTIEDLNSTNGTYVQGRRVTQVARLENGDRIRIGRATLVLRAWKDADAPTKRVRPPKASP